MPNILEARNISKKYKIYNQQQSAYSTLVETLTNSAKNFISRSSKKNSFEELWALQDIDLNIEEGDRFGIIGKNGAGKSTLLKVFSRITHPSTGTIKIRGRVASLLEVGTGFHPELSGRENIFLNGAILGMTHREIKQKFDAIVAFGEVEKFLDTPVKRFSSGMHMRLGFAIAAHLDPDLLILDEVLAVGDSQFQEKCLRKLRELEKKGKTILFVSHDMSSLLQFCNKGVYLEKGRIKEMGPIETCVSTYMNTWHQATSWQGQVGDSHIMIKSANLSKPEALRDFYFQDEKIRMEIQYEILKGEQDIGLAISIWNKHNQLLARTSTLDEPQLMGQFSKLGKHCAIFDFNASLLLPGEYWVKVEACIHNSKTITLDDIILNLHVYSRNNGDRLTPSLERGGISLGNLWNTMAGHHA
jgi:lipopolysaccharide transport system ATP-binding protein